MKLSSLAVYCGSSRGFDSTYIKEARQMGLGLAEKGISLIYGGGNLGLMGAVADGCLEGGGKVIGVIPHKLIEKELAHKGLTELHTVSTMHERKMKMADLADGFVAMPGGIGTLEEIMEVFTWSQLGYHTKPCALFNILGYYDPLLTFLGTIVKQGFMRKEYLDTFIVNNDAEALLNAMQSYERKEIYKWFDREEPSAKPAG